MADHVQSAGPASKGNFPVPIYVIKQSWDKEVKEWSSVSVHYQIFPKTLVYVANIALFYYANKNVAICVNKPLAAELTPVSQLC